ncbi:MAG: hypothetical protein ACREQ2_07025 [Candidatus Binatia bacterium]
MVSSSPGQEQVRSLALLFAIFILSLTATYTLATDFTRVWTGFLAVAGLANHALFFRRAYWFSMTLALALNLFYRYEIAANHYFLSVYVSALFAVWVAPDGTRFVKVGGTLLALVMVFAVVGKLLSPYYLKGNLVGEVFLTGSLSGPLRLVWPEIRLSVNHYVVNFEAAKAIPPGVAVGLAASVPSTAFASFCQATAISIIVIEGLVAAAFAARWKHQAALLAIFLWGTYIFRAEHHFLALLAFLGLTSLESPMSRYGKILRLSFYFFVVMGTVQYRPAFLH